MDKERIDGFRSAFAPGETLFWQVPAAARERMAFYSENLPRLFSEKNHGGICGVRPLCAGIYAIFAGTGHPRPGGCADHWL